MTSSAQCAQRAADFRAIFEGLPGLCLILTPDLVIVAVTDAYLAATMTKRDEILGRGLFDVFPDNPDDAGATGTHNLRSSLTRVISDKVTDSMAVQKYDVRRPEAEGGEFETRYWSPVNSPILGADGELRYIVHRVEDVTEFVRVRQVGTERDEETRSLRTLTEQKEAEVLQRAQEVAGANRALHAAKAQIEVLYERSKELDTLKSQFFANVSHELRTPLTLILGPVDRIRASGEVGPEALRDLETVARNARLLLRHVSDLLDIARLEAGKTQPRLTSIDLSELVRVAASHFDSLARDRGASLRVETDESVPIEADPAQVSRVVINLLSNAFKFSPTQGQVIVRTRISSDGSQGVIEVADDGPGIAPRDREAVFERFRQLEGGPRRRWGGTGLGLAIAREFVELHGGRIFVDSAPEGGALFVVELPVRAPEGSKITAQTPWTAAYAAQLAVGPTLDQDARDSGNEMAPVDLTDDRPRVLVVEDNLDMRRFVCSSLPESLRAIPARNGAEGFEFALRYRPELIVTDMMMPEMSGEDLLTAIRSHPDLSDTPIILLTAKADDDSRLRLLRAGASDYVTKPFSAEELVARVGNLVEQRLASQEAKRLSRELALKTARLELVGNELAVANTELEAFCYSVAHDLRAPLRSIDGFSQALVEDLGRTLDEGSRSHLDRIRKAAQRMGELIDDLLGLSRISRAPLKRRSIDLGALALIVHGELAAQYPARKVELQVTGDLACEADLSLLRAVFENLLGNAWKFTRRREVAHIEVGRDVDAGETVYFVKDDGAGFDMRYVKSLFQTFQRLHTPADFEGTGIGLATVSRIIRRHGGRVFATGEIDRGATIFFTLPPGRETS